MRGDIDDDAAKGFRDRRTSRAGWPTASRCGPMPSVWTTWPIAPSATSLPALTAERTQRRSEKQIEKILPVSATVLRTSSSWAKVVTPGLSTITSLPACIARMARPARSRGMAAMQITSMLGSANSCSRSIAGDIGIGLAEGFEQGRDRGLGAIADELASGCQQPFDVIEYMPMINSDDGKSNHCRRFLFDFRCPPPTSRWRRSLPGLVKPDRQSLPLSSAFGPRFWRKF